MVSNIELVLDAKASLAEGPSWNEKKQLLYWVNIVEKQLCIFSPTANTNRVIALNQQIGCVVPYLDDILLQAMPFDVFTCETFFSTFKLLFKQ
ncbi:SMP-30/gluconolactonase/LRE family protein, partial [Bacillus sp. D-CC]